MRGLRCSTAHHAADTSPGLLSHSPRASRSPPRCSSAPSPGRLRPPSQPSSPAPPQGLRLRERRGEGGASRSSSPRGGVKVRKGVAEPGRGGGRGEGEGEAAGDALGGTGLADSDGGRYSPQRYDAEGGGGRGGVGAVGGLQPRPMVREIHSDDTA